jgi:lysyl-tRNA synthetase class 2
MNKNNYTENPSVSFSDEYSIRKEKAYKIGLEYQSAWPNLAISDKHSIDYIKSIDSSDGVLYAIAGRITSIRNHGNSIFMHVVDGTGTIQVYYKKSDDSKLYNLIANLFDIGDICYFKGELFFTKTGEKTLNIKQALMLSKCLHNIPDQYVGFEDVEARYRKRYLDIIVHNDVKNIFFKRVKIIKHIRNFLDNLGYCEVETPMLHPIPGGALARPFKTHHNALNTDLFLRIAPELYLKQLIVAGFDKVYEINKNFRNEGVSVRHNPEFTMLEFYTAYNDYVWAMNMVEEILRSACLAVNNSYSVSWNGIAIDFKPQFDRLDPYQAVLKYTEFSDAQLAEHSINDIIDSSMHGVSYDEKIFFLFEKYAEHKIMNPTFLINFPLVTSPLAKASHDNPQIACRFELFICGMEIANAYNELNNPFDQSERFLKQASERESGNNEAMYYDNDFITALEYGMPPTVGVGIGIDRVTMLLTGAKSIKDVILFPTMKKII